MLVDRPDEGLERLAGALPDEGPLVAAHRVEDAAEEFVCGAVPLGPVDHAPACARDDGGPPSGVFLDEFGKARRGPALSTTFKLYK